MLYAIKFTESCFELYIGADYAGALPNCSGDNLCLEFHPDDERFLQK